jgi:hypothetical protein
MAINPNTIADYIRFFSGNEKNYGEHIYNFNGEGKENGSNSTITNKLLTQVQYKDHLEGKKGLGIIPIKADSNCLFGVIDIDLYENLNMYISAIEKNNLPLVPFRSKSGGLHLYMFLKNPVAAKSLIDLLSKFVFLLGLDILVKQKLNKMVEIFPKQIKIQENNPGNWINAPYYNAEKTKQYAIKDGKPLSLDDAIFLIRERQTTIGAAVDLIKELPFNDGPPCLETINVLNILERNSGRNNYLFSCGVYLKKKDEDIWQQRLQDINNSLPESIDQKELDGTIIQSLNKKDYIYKCNDTPCVDFCRKNICKKREFGIGKEDGYFSELIYGKLFQIKINEPYYEWQVKVNEADEFKLLRFRNEDEIIKQDAFLRLCFRELHILPAQLKKNVWFALVNQCLKELEIKDVDKNDDTSPFAIFKSIFIEFIADKAKAQNKEQILQRRVFFDEELQLYCFRVTDLIVYLYTVKNFRYYTPQEIHGILRDLKVKGHKIFTNNKQFRVSVVAKQDIDEIRQIEVIPFKAEFVKKGEF